MRTRAALLALCFALVPAAAQASGIAYRTQHQAQDYLDHRLTYWAGVNLQTRKYKFRVSFCLDGARSTYEKRHHRHFKAKTSPSGVRRYHTFACTLAAADKLWHLYLVARPNGSFFIRNDR